MTSRLLKVAIQAGVLPGLLSLLTQTLMAQHYHGHAGAQQSSQGLTAGQRMDAAGYGRSQSGHGDHGHSGAGQTGFGNFRATGPVTYGQPGLVQQFGGSYYSSGTFSSNSFGRSHFGVGRGSAGVIHYSSGLVVPGFAGTYGYGFSPVAIGYGAAFSPYCWGSPAYDNSGMYGWANDPWLGFGLPYYDPWCQFGFPCYGGFNPCFSGSMLAPTVLSLNAAMPPFVPSTASYTLTDPRILDLIAPAPDAFPPVPPLPADEVLDAVPQLNGAEGVPILNEFEAVPRSEKMATLSEKIDSLRYQSTGDDAFRKEDYATAEVFYQSAIELAPDRRAPYLRMAFAQIALGDFAKAVSCLKTGLIMPGDATRSWVTADELYGQRVAERARSHGGKLWNWLAEQPLSSDRLLLAGTFQTLRGFDVTASELLELSSHEGPEVAYVSALLEIARTDFGQRPASEDRVRVQQESEAADSVVPTAAAGRKGPFDRSAAGHVRAAEDGIFMRGKVGRRVPDRADSVPPAPPVPMTGIVTEVEPDPAAAEIRSIPMGPPPLQIPVQ